MKKPNGFIATSVLYSFFLAFITIFIAMITIYLQNRVYLDKLEDSSKKNIYISEMKNILDSEGYIYIIISNKDNDEKNESSFEDYNDNIFIVDINKSCNVSLCENIYINDENYVLEGCPDSCL